MPLPQIFSSFFKLMLTSKHCPAYSPNHLISTLNHWLYFISDVDHSKHHIAFKYIVLNLLLSLFCCLGPSAPSYLLTLHHLDGVMSQPSSFSFTIVLFTGTKRSTCCVLSFQLALHQCLWSFKTKPYFGLHYLSMLDLSFSNMFDLFNLIRYNMDYVHIKSNTNNIVMTYMQARFNASRLKQLLLQLATL